VAADERETGDRRALLNLGHTFAHALETATGYGDALLHGEAVGIGMVLAFDLSAQLGICPAHDAQRVRRHLASVGLPVSPPPGLKTEDLLRHMGGDKKVRDGRLVFILARGIGRAEVVRDVDPALVRLALEHARA
jgi:3-dehydroquinate synthase